MLLSFRYNIDADFFYKDTSIEDDEWLLFVDQIIVCIAVLFWSLLCKTILIKYVAVAYYFKKYEAQIKAIQSFELWLAILLKNSQIFSQHALEFLHFNYLHRKANRDNQSKNQKHFEQFYLQNFFQYPSIKVSL